MSSQPPVDRHVETETIPGRRLGRRPHDPQRPALKLAHYLTGVVPSHPSSADFGSKVANWEMLGNDQWGDCGPAAACHMRMQVSQYLTGTALNLITDDALALYKLCNPDFDPSAGTGDNGVVLADMLAQLQAHGIRGVKPLAYAKVNVSDPDELRAAIDLFGSVLLGVDLETAQQQQTDNHMPWNYVPSSQWGGHAVLGVAFTSAGTGSDIAVVSWGTEIGMTQTFERRQISEAWVVIWPEHLGSIEFQQGVNLPALAAGYTALTGRPFPGNPTPTPQPPGPSVDPADQALATALGPWLSEHHSGDNKRAATAVRTWMAAKGL
ncbi:hypothetical protein [Kutzneria albida]|uniref:Uncharacterized protein n=1 Tax=Kutzneria albida DSM 43870 TaxID=1449976 RepID=W5WB21_9PSEU|nr:hypothetical protein [Kutzneria albida]AHH98343.1 hypothetical protein KALB_4981 [Kutzneria albida DSM 43870]